MMPVSNLRDSSVRLAPQLSGQVAARRNWRGDIP